MFGGLSMTEVLVILVIALILFGPRKLPELGRSIGQSLAQFRRASEEFKRSWEEEILMEEKRLNVSTWTPPSSPSEPNREPKDNRESED
ncbi:Sec-independent protein translocase protein TatAd [bacterium HR08]|nr:Sec-independent protein translocase protein TatAd [bacterium HR08]